MSGGVSGDFAGLRELRQRLASLPEVNAAVARRAAGAVTASFQASFDARMSPYGNPWRAGKRGPVTLHKSGRLRSGIQFVPVGTRLRCALGAPYARYQIFRGILPRGGAPLPAQWEEAIRKEALAELDARMSGRAR